MPEPVSIVPISDQARLNLRIATPNAAGDVLGVPLPSRIGDARRDGEILTLCLGPDEWMILTPNSQKEVLEGKILALPIPHSLVDVSHSFKGLDINGPGAIDVLHMGCPLNLANVPISGVARTIFDHVEIIVIRVGETRFRVEFGLSVAAYMAIRLRDAQRELSGEAP